jgi:pyruvate ferredoxin oxidoreductase beta subunit/2-oxoisovalerate ferredoxin oxidoreductase beta subunit
VVAATFASAAALATGLVHAARLNGEQTRVLCWAGDGGTYDIGMATLSAAAERNEDILYVCYDNEIYGNTGGQRFATPPGPRPRRRRAAGEKKDIMGSWRHTGCLAATLSIAHGRFRDKIRTAGHRGFRFFLLHAPCPTGWKTEPAESIELVRLAVRSGVFPLYEVVDGVKYRINVEPDGTDPAEYFGRQKRFGGGAVDLEALGRAVAERNRRLRQLAEMA